MALKQIKNKIKSVKKTSKVTKAMEAVSAVKMRKSQEKALQGRPYAVSALTILKRVSRSLEGLNHPLSENRTILKKCIVVITSDKGLAGSLNSSVLKEANSVIANNKSVDIKILAIGKKGYEHFSKRRYAILGNYSGIDDDLQVTDINEITDVLIDEFKNNNIDECVIVYPHFRSTFEQLAVTRTLLPLSFDNIEHAVKDILPKVGKFSHIADDDKKTQTYTVEPNAESVLNELIPKLLNIELYHAVLELKASEHSARMVAMKNASDKARDLSRELNLKFNKERQAIITREVSEIIGGIETMKV